MKNNCIIRPNKMLKSFLCDTNIKFPLGKNHSISGKQISFASNFICIENTLSSFTNNINCFLQGFTTKFKK